MNSLTEFETQLKAIVTAKRLSSSKMAALTDLAVESMHLDTQMISLLYRTHKGLPSSNKISSLYVFDSIARAAHRKSKKGLVADLNNPVGNAASFLIRLEGMLDGVVEDMLTNGPSEAKEKTRKVVDIWTREGTFSAAALKRLSERVSGSNTGQPSNVHTPPTPATSLPPAILALLGSAVPTQPPPPQQFNLDQTQLALITQLTSQTSTPPFSPTRNGSNLPVLQTASTRPFSPTAPPYSPVRKDEGAPPFQRSRSGSPRNDDRRGAKFEQGRGSRFDDTRSRDPRRRSRSPRNRRTSPGRRPVSPGRARAPLPSGEGKDEFGRDLRGGDGERSPQQQSYPQTTQPQSYNTSSQPPSSGLESFEMAAFNPADPASWTALAAAWETTNGRAPTQEEMMMFVMGGSASGNGGASAGAGAGDAGGWGQGGRGRGRGRGGFRGRGRGRGRGGFGGNHGGESYNGAGYGGDAYGGFGGSDAVVLGGGDDPGQEYANGQYGNAQGYEYGTQDTTASAPSSGGMKKIDGKWVWTKN